MASDVVRAGTVDRRSYRNAGLVQFAILAVVALAIALDDSGPYDSAVWVPGLLGLGVVLLWLWWWAMPRVVSSWVVEIGPDAVKWHGGWRRRDRVVPRAQVVASRRHSNGGFTRLGFHDSAGRRIGVLPISRLPAGRVIAALRRHDWPVPEHEDLTEPLSRWR